MKMRGAPGGTQAYADARRRRNKWLTAVICMAALVVFCTVYALVMPAATLEGDTYCGATEHTHTEECYESVLSCGLEEGEEHTHDESCYEDALTCDLPEHTHTAECYVNPEEAEGADTETADTEEAEDAEAVADETAETASLPDGAAVPDGYTQQYTVRDEENGFAVTVYAPEGALPEGATLSAALLGEADDAYAEAETALLAETPEALSADGEDESEETTYGFAALDIHFEDAEGNEIEPDGSVYVVIDAAGLLPEDADPETVTVQHHAETDGTVSVETVADAADETDGVVAVTDETAVQAAFEVDSFSTFTISWSSGNTTYFRVTVHYVDEDGNEIQGTRTSDISTSSVSNNNSVTYTFSDYAGTISGYTYSGAHYNSYNGSTVTSMTFSQTSNWGGGTTRTLTFYNEGMSVAYKNYATSWGADNTADVYLVYTSDSTSGGSTGDGSGDSSTVTSATVTTSKTAVLDEDNGTYDLTLTISGDRGSVEQKVAVDIVFILDKSGSMRYKLTGDSNAGNNEDSRMDLLQDAVATVVDTIEENTNIDARYAAVDFAGASQTRTQTWTSASTIRSYVNNLSANGGTNYQAGIYQAKQLLNNAREGAITFVIFVSDGIPTFRGTSSDSGTGSDDDNGYNIAAAVTEIGSMSCNYFYAIGMGPEFTLGGTGMTNLTRLANEVQAANGTGVYSATDEDSFTKAFDEITSSITFFAASNVTITDQLSDYADLVLDADGNAQFTITVTRAAYYTDSDGTQREEQTWTTETPVGNNGTLTFQNASDENVTLTASYNSTTKTITLDFPDDYELEEGYTYSISTVIEPSQAAIDAGMDSDAAKQTPDSGTGTHADDGEQGFWSNGEAKVTYTANEVEGSAAFPKPVIQVTQVLEDVTIKKTDNDSNVLADAEFQLYYTVTTESDEGEVTTKYYYQEVTTGEGEDAVTTVKWISEDEITETDQPTTLTSDSDGILTFQALDTSKTYYLVETKAPDGYQLLEQEIKISWDNTTKQWTACVGGSPLTVTDGSIQVENQTGAKLPETGGAGTTLFTISGLLVLAVAAGGGTVMRRRRGREGN